jgi:hypothetical protein
MRVEKTSWKSFANGIKRSAICADFKKMPNSCFLSKMEIFRQKNRFFGNLSCLFAIRQGGCAPWRAGQVAGAGRGLFATRNIQGGE